MMKQFIISVGLFSVTIALAALMSGCSKTIRERAKDAAAHSSIEQTAVMKVFELAKNVAKGLRSETELKSSFDDLSDAEIKELALKREGSSSFALFVVAAPASNVQADILTKYLSIAGNTKDPKDQVIILSLLKELNKDARPPEDANARIIMVTTILERYPEMINSLNKNGSFDIKTFNEIISRGNNATVQLLISKLNPNNLDIWTKWLSAAANKTEAQPLFKATFAKLTPQQQSKMGDLLLANMYKQNRIGEFIDDADAWGFKPLLNTHLFVLDSGKGETFTGSLAYVLAKMTALEDKYADFRNYMIKFKAALNNPAQYITHVTATNWGIVPHQEHIDAALQKALRPSNRDNLANYYLTLETPTDVFNAAKRPAAQVSNTLLKDIYNFIIGANDANAVALGTEPTAGVGDSFINLLAQRPVDQDSNFLLDKFLTSIFTVGGIPAVRNQLKNTTNALIPLKLLIKSKAGGTQEEIAKMFNRLMRDDDGTAVSKLTPVEVDSFVTETYTNSDAINKANFILVYNGATPGRKDRMRNKLLELAIDPRNPQKLQILLDQITDPLDPWGLRGGIETDGYKYAGTLLSGPLVYILAKKALNAAASGDNEAYDIFRIHAQTLKSAMPNFVNIVTAQAFAGGDIIRNLFTAQLGPSKVDFVNYYLASETIADMLSAAERPQAQVDNQSLRELYNLLIGNDNNEVFRLFNQASAIPGNPSFLNRLLMRGIDANTLYIVNKYMSGLFSHSGIAGEQNALNDNSGLKRPLKIILEQGRAAVDNASAKSAVLNRLSRHADAHAITGLLPVDFSANGSFLYQNPAAFKTLYSLYLPNSAEARALRSAVLAEAVDAGATATRKFLQQISDPLNVWGLNTVPPNAAMTATIYDLAGASGSLLFVLTNKANLEDAAGKKNAYRDLKSFASIIRSTFSLPGDYITLIGVTTWPGTGTIKNLLSTHLTPTHRQLFTNVYLANGQTQDVFDAAATPEAQFSNKMLKDLYLLTVSNDDVKAFNLSTIKIGSDKFIHHLMRRSADIDGYLNIVLDKYLTSLEKHSGIALVQSELNDNDTGAIPYPIQMLADATRTWLPIVSGDDPGQKALLFARLLRNDTGVASGSISRNDLRAQRFFAAGDKGKAAFKALYAKIKGTPQKAKAMRGNLLNEAYALNPANTVQLIDPGSIPGNDWGLLNELDTPDDLYVLRNRAGLGNHEGNYLYVTTKRLSEDAVASGKRDLYNKVLQKIAEIIKKHLDTAIPASYVPYTQLASPIIGDDAAGALKAVLDPTLPGFAEYYLRLDNTYPSVNAALVFENWGLSGVNFSPPVAIYLYQQAIKNDADAANLAAQGGLPQDMFIHRIVSRPLNIDTALILHNFLDLVGNNAVNLGAPNGDAARAQEIASLDPANQNALQLYLTSLAKKTPSLFSSAILLMLASYADAATIASINTDAGIARLLDATDAPTMADLRAKAIPSGMSLGDLAAINFYDLIVLPLPQLAKLTTIALAMSDARLKALAEWCANHSSHEAAAAFNASYALRGVPQKAIMRNTLITKAFELSFSQSRTGALEKITQLVTDGFFDQATLFSGTFQPFNAAADSSLLYAVIAKLISEVGNAPANIRPQIEALASSMKLRAPNWQNYLQDGTLNPGGESIIQGLMNKAGIAQALAEAWLQF